MLTSITWCCHCSETAHAQNDPESGISCCLHCGRVLSEYFPADEPSFVKDSDCWSIRTDNPMESEEMDSSALYWTLQKGRAEIYGLFSALKVGGGDEVCKEASRYFKLAAQRQFTRGRKKSHIAAACVYMVCRQENIHCPLVDLSDYLEISIHELGAVFLQLCEVLQVENYPIIENPDDPCLFNHRIAECLLKDENKAVRENALRTVSHLKRDSMETGRKPAGLSGYMLALSHGSDYSKADVEVAHVREAKLIKILFEYENAEFGCLRTEEFISKVDDFNPDANLICSPKVGEILCEHKGSDAQDFALGLCEICYHEFVKISEGVSDGSESPAFQDAGRKRIGAATREIRVTEQCPKNSAESNCDEPSDVNVEDDPETFAVIDEGEFHEYILKEEEVKSKRTMWEETNSEYLAAEQAAKECIAALETLDEDSKRKRELERKRADESDATSAETPPEATCNILRQKGFASKAYLGYLYNIDDYEEKSEGASGVDADERVVGEPSKDDMVDFFWH